MIGIGEPLVVPDVHPDRVVGAGEDDELDAGTSGRLVHVPHTDDVGGQDLLPAGCHIRGGGQMDDAVSAGERALESRQVGDIRIGM